MAGTSFSASSHQTGAGVSSVFTALSHPSGSIAQRPGSIRDDENFSELQPSAAMLCDSKFAELWSEASSKQPPSDKLRILPSSLARSVVPSSEASNVNGTCQNESSAGAQSCQCAVLPSFCDGPVPMQVVISDDFLRPRLPGMKSLAGPSHYVTNDSSPSTADASTSLGLPSYRRSQLFAENPVVASNPPSMPLGQRLHDCSDLNSTITSLLLENGNDKREIDELSAVVPPPAKGAKVDISSILVLHPPRGTNADVDDAAMQTQSQHPEQHPHQQVRQRLRKATAMHEVSSKQKSDSFFPFDESIQAASIRGSVRSRAIHRQRAFESYLEGREALDLPVHTLRASPSGAG